MARRIIRKPELARLIQLSDPTIWRLEQTGRFPKRIRLSSNACGWFEDEIDKWLEMKGAERDAREV